MKLTKDQDLQFENFRELYLAKKYIIVTISIYLILAFVSSVIANFTVMYKLNFGNQILGSLQIIFILTLLVSLYFVLLKDNLITSSILVSFVSFFAIIAVILVDKGGNNSHIFVPFFGLIVFTLLKLRAAMISYAICSTIVILLSLFVHDIGFPFMLNLIIAIILTGGLLIGWSYATEVAKKRLALASRTDDLTGLWNRKKLKEELLREMEAFNKSHSPLTIMLSDIDFFKRVNDQYGHDVGDEVLVKVADVLRNSINNRDMVARWGGEEFAFIFPNRNESEAKQIAINIMEELSKAEFNISEKVTISSGIVIYDANVEYDEMFRRADRALFESKENGRNMCTVYDERKTEK